MRYDITLELGKKKIFACANDWPGWCRWGKDEAAAIQALLIYSIRYARVVKRTNLEFAIPEHAEDFNVIERVAGNLTTDFGVPEIIIPSDYDPTSPEEVERFKDILKACWAAFDYAVRRAQGKELRKGPRGGGRELAEIVEHVAGAESGYAYRLGRRAEIDRGKPAGEQYKRIRSQILETMDAAAKGELPTEGPRGGKKWPVRYYVRRAAWHVLDHAWEIEDRVM
jgi:hypothetical protein